MKGYLDCTSLKMKQEVSIFFNKHQWFPIFF